VEAVELAILLCPCQSMIYSSTPALSQKVEGVALLLLHSHRLLMLNSISYSALFSSSEICIGTSIILFPVGTCALIQETIFRQEGCGDKQDFSTRSFR
jgi:hypothetical protein